MDKLQVKLNKLNNKLTTLAGLGVSRSKLISVVEQIIKLEKLIERNKTRVFKTGIKLSSIIKQYNGYFRRNKKGEITANDEQLIKEYQYARLGNFAMRYHSKFIDDLGEKRYLFNQFISPEYLQQMILILKNKNLLNTAENYIIKTK